MKAVKKHRAQGDGNRYRYVVIGGSAGGVEALRVILMALPVDFALPILVAHHLHASDEGAYTAHVARLTRLIVVESCGKDPISAKAPVMSQSAIDTGAVDEVLSAEQIGSLLATLGERATL